MISFCTWKSLVEKNGLVYIFTTISYSFQTIKGAHMAKMNEHAEFMKNMNKLDKILSGAKTKDIGSV
jgi:hypothetical protein